MIKSNHIQIKYTTYLSSYKLKYPNFKTFPQSLTPRQLRLVFSTIIKLSSPTQVPIILTNLLHHTQLANADSFSGGVDEQLTYFYAFIDCLPWIEGDSVEFWLDQVCFAARGLKGTRREGFVKRLWECVSGEMGGEGGLRAVEWWVNGGNTRVMNPKL